MPSRRSRDHPHVEGASQRLAVEGWRRVLSPSRRRARRRRRACAATSASSRRYFKKCSECALIHPSGSRDSNSTSSDESDTSKARTYANGSIRCRLAPARMLKQIAAVSPPWSLLINRDPPLPVRERRDADTELSAEVGDGQVGLLLPLESTAPPVEPRLVARPMSRAGHKDPPGTASDAGWEPGYHTRQGWFGRALTDNRLEVSGTRRENVRGNCNAFQLRTGQPHMPATR